jgi:hypothetical protein
MSDKLTFSDLDKANNKRLASGAFQRGEQLHSSLDDWNELEWCGAVCGEAGEAANKAKKLRRGDYDNDVDAKLAAEYDLAKELADTIIYASLAIQRLGFSTGAMVAAAFNDKSKQIGSGVLL